MHDEDERNALHSHMKRLGWFVAIYAVSLSIFAGLIWLMRLLIP